MINIELYNCHICESNSIELLMDFDFNSSVTSDCVPFEFGSKLGICHNCGTIQKIQDQFWNKNIELIYNNYEVYKTTGGIDQPIFSNNQEVETRSKKICNYLYDELKKFEAGSVLEIGCGNGVFLKEFSNFFPIWKKVGCELNEKHKNTINSIPNTEFFSGDLKTLNRKFDLIVMIHSLEHIFFPIEFLKSIKNLLNKNGMIFIEVPNFLMSPFDITIYDHCTHFYLSNLKNILNYCGLIEIKAQEDYIKKELSLLYVNSAKTEQHISMNNPSSSEISKTRNILLNNISWLKKLTNDFIDISKKSRCGIFGSSISATFLHNFIKERTDFFVDNDSNRSGKKHLGKLILQPDLAPKDKLIFLPFRPDIALNIFKNNQEFNLEFKLPPMDYFNL